MADMAEAPLSMLVGHKSQWATPVPYVFGGLWAVLLLIGFTLSVLACSCDRLNTRRYSERSAAETELESGDGGSGTGNVRPHQVFDEECLVIMAGEARPTYLATPMWSRASSFDSNASCSTDKTQKSDVTVLVEK